MILARENKRSWRIPRTVLVVAIATFLVLGTSVGAFAYWSAQASLASTAKAGSLAVTLVGVDTLTDTFVNHDRKHTGYVTVENTSPSTSTTPVPVSIALGYAAGGSAKLAEFLNVTMWGPTAAANCTNTAATTGTVVTGSWLAPPTLTKIDGPSASGPPMTWCIRTENVERSNISSPTGTLSIRPTVTSTLTAGTWSATASATASAPQSTQYIFPAFTPLSSARFNLVAASGDCLEVSASGGVGSGLARSTCNDAPNKVFRPGTADGFGYFSLTPTHSLSLRWGNGGSTAAGAVVTVQNATGLGSQAWQLQTVTAGVYQIVNNSSGLCVSSSAASPSTTTQEVCNGSADQRFTLKAITLSTSLTCASMDNQGSKGWVLYSWSAAVAGMYTFQADYDVSAGVDWQTIGSSGVNDNFANITGLLPSNNPLKDQTKTTLEVRVLDASNNLVATSSITVRPSGGIQCGLP